jgi:hypothetical protein
MEQEIEVESFNDKCNLVVSYVLHARMLLESMEPNSREKSLAITKLDETKLWIYEMQLQENNK